MAETKSTMAQRRRARRRDELLRSLTAWQLADLLVDQEFLDEGREE